jgi:hypothetical protein
MYCLKGSIHMRICVKCDEKLYQGRCTNSSCKAKGTWKELPYGSLIGVLARKYDADLGTFEPKYPESYASAVRLKVPTHPSDPKHFGHLAWFYCRSMENLDSPTLSNSSGGGLPL